MSENVKVQGRQIRGWMLFCESQQLHGLSFTHPISQKVMQWFQTRYGDRLNLDFTLGHFVEILRGDLFRARCVLFFGELHLICSFPVMGHSQKRPLNQPALLNVLDFVEGMTPSFAKELASRESQALLRGFTTAYVHFARIADLPPLPFVSEARGDLREAVEHMFRPIACGLLESRTPRSSRKGKIRRPAHGRSRFRIPAKPRRSQNCAGGVLRKIGSSRRSAGAAAALPRMPQSDPARAGHSNRRVAL
jgi:hypothetical protein